MTNLFLLFIIVAEFLKVIVKAFASLFRVKKEKAAPKTLNKEWYGSCENCGKYGGLHRFQEKRYCAVCHARIKTEYDFENNKNSN